MDLLADQVDVLVDLLEKIYIALHHHSPVMQQYFEVRDASSHYCFNMLCCML